MAKTRLSISNDQALELAELFRLMGDASRLKILAACLNKPRCVSDIAADTRLSPTLVSHHLRLLRSTCMLRSERKGRQVFYVATDERVQCIFIDMIDHLTELDREEA